MSLNFLFDILNSGVSHKNLDEGNKTTKLTVEKTIK